LSGIIENIKLQLNFLFSRLWEQPQNFLEIIILAIIVYYIILFIRGTRTVAVLRGALFLVALFGLAKWLHFDTINLVFKGAANIILFGFIVMFIPELRRALIAIGRQTFVRRVIGTKLLTLSPIVDAAKYFTTTNTGALIAIERSVGLRNYTQSAVILDAELSNPLLKNIFYPKSPLHDGGVIVEGGRILAAACIFPLSTTPSSYIMGTRHRAALGMSEETDALVICVSEETGKISIFENGECEDDASINTLSNRLAQISV